MSQTNLWGSGPSAGPKQRPVNRQLWLVVAIIPMLALVGLLAWGLIKSGGKPGGLGVNSKLGEVQVRQAPAQDFSLTTFNGGNIQLSSLKGKVVLLDFWASWCIPCRQEAPALARVYKEYKGKGVEFVGIDIWDKEGDARDYLRQFGITYPNGLDNSGGIAINYGVTGIPEKFFIGSDGVLLKKFVGPMDDERLKAELDSLLAR